VSSSIGEEIIPRCPIPRCALPTGDGTPVSPPSALPSELADAPPSAAPNRWQDSNGGGGNLKAEVSHQRTNTVREVSAVAALNQVDFKVEGF
jgi:hypothetical protein